MNQKWFHCNMCFPNSRVFPTLPALFRKILICNYGFNNGHFIPSHPVLINDCSFFFFKDYYHPSEKKASFAEQIFYEPTEQKCNQNVMGES